MRSFAKACGAGKEQEDRLFIESDWLEQALEEGLDSTDILATKGFWTDLRKELHREHKNGSRAR